MSSPSSRRSPSPRVICTKSYGQDVTSLVAADYTISGLQPGVLGAFLPDTASAVYSGAPIVTSLGSPPRASVAGSPYPITVAPGSFAVFDNYALVLDFAGRLTIDPLPLTYAVADANSIYGTTPVLGAATLSGVLPGDAVSATVGAFSGSDGGRGRSADPGRNLFRAGDGALEPRLCRRAFRKHARNADDRPARADLRRRRRQLGFRHVADAGPGDAVRRAPGRYRHSNGRRLPRRDSGRAEPAYASGGVRRTRDGDFESQLPHSLPPRTSPEFSTISGGSRTPASCPA